MGRRLDPNTTYFTLDEVGWLISLASSIEEPQEFRDEIAAVIYKSKAMYRGNTTKYGVLKHG